MHPLVGRDRAGFGQLDHADRRCIATLPAGPAFQRRLELPDRRVSRSADGAERQARPGLAAIALDLEPAQPAVEALGDRWGRLRGPAIAFRPQRPCAGLRAIGLTGGFLCVFPGLPRAYVGAHDLAAPDHLSRFGAHGR